MELFNGHVEKGHFDGTRGECPGCMAGCKCSPFMAPWKCVWCEHKAHTEAREEKF